MIFILCCLRARYFTQYKVDLRTLLKRSSGFKTIINSERMKSAPSSWSRDRNIIGLYCDKHCTLNLCTKYDIYCYILILHRRPNLMNLRVNFF